MSWVHDTLADYGRRIGIERLDFGSHGVAQLQLESGGLVAVEPVEREGQDEVLVYIGRPAGHDAGRVYAAALAKAHHSHGGPFALQVALRGHGPEALLLALTRLPERSFTPQTLAHAVDHLRRWLDEVHGR